MAVVIGAGGHAKVVIDTLVAGGIAFADIVVRDSDLRRAGSRLLGIGIETPDVVPGLSGADIHIAIGSCAVRARLHKMLIEVGARPLLIRHPSASIATGVSLAPGSFIAAQAVIGPEARIGASVIINHNAVVDHDCIVGDFCHIAPGAIIGGGVCIGEAVLVGAGAVVLPGVCVDAGATIGAGAVVTRSVGAGETWVGNPAHKREECARG
jgi:sugar O-acyltransferase (sialic acid O-acetyltransferase NeuD family)